MHPVKFTPAHLMKLTSLYPVKRTPLYHLKHTWWHPVKLHHYILRKCIIPVKLQVCILLIFTDISYHKLHYILLKFKPTSCNNFITLLSNFTFKHALPDHQDPSVTLPEHNLLAEVQTVDSSQARTQLTWGAESRFISSRRVCRGPSEGLLFFRASSRKDVHCWIRLNSINTSTIWKVKRQRGN